MARGCRLHTSCVNMRAELQCISKHNYTWLFVEHSYQTSLGYTFTAQSSKCCLPQGVSPEPAQWSGGSAAQSAAIQLLDAGLGVEHGGGEGAFLVRMRDYM